MTDPGLFDVDAPGDPGRGERRQRLIAARIARGVHPLGNVLLHPDAARGRDGEGLRCGTCQWRRTAQYHDKRYAKCWYGDGIRVSHSESSDIRSWWPACTDYEKEVPSGT